MKAEERHRLQENELQRLAEHARERTRPFFDRYGTTLLLGLAAVLVVAAAIVWWVRSGSADHSAGWSDLSAVFRKPDASAEDFANVAELFPGSRAAIWAKLYEGELHLTTGIESLFTDKEGATRDLADARAAFEVVLDEPEAGPDITVRALYGLARTLETTSDGDLGLAIERYEQIVEQYEGTVYEKIAADRLAALKSPDARSFYAWFSKQEPTIQDRLSHPLDGSGAFPTLPGMTLPGGASPFAPGGASPIGGGTDSPPSLPVEAPRPAGAQSETDGAATPAAESPADATSVETTTGPSDAPTGDDAAAPPP